MIKLDIFHLKLLLLLAFVSTSIAVLVAWLNPTVGYESSIFQSTPPLFWILYIISILLSLIVLLNISSKKRCHGYLRILTFFIVVLNGIVLISLYIIRGYLAIGMNSDTGSHIGSLSLLLESGFTHSYYPAMYIHTATIQLMSNIEIYHLINTYTIVLYLVLILGMFMLLRKLLKLPVGYALAFFIVSFYPYGVSNYMTGPLYVYTPWLAAMTTLPLFIYSIFKMRESLSTTRPKYFILSAILFTSMCIFHIFIGICALLFVACVVCVEMIHPISIRYKKNNIDNRFISPTLPIFAICFIILTIWIVLQGLLHYPVETIFEFFFVNLEDKNIDGLNVGLGYVEILFAGEYSVVEIISIVFRQLGLLIIFGIICILSIPIIYINRMKNEEYQNMLSLFFFALIGCIMYILPLITAAPIESGRAVPILIIFGVVCLGYLIRLVYQKIDESRLSNNRHRILNVFLCVVIILCVLMVVNSSIMLSYRAIESYQMSDQTTNALICGMDFYLSEANFNRDVITAGFFVPARYAKAIYGSEYIRHDAIDYTFNKVLSYFPSIANNFGYTSYLTVGSQYNSSLYLPVMGKETERAQIELNRWGREYALIPFVPDDIIHLNSDDTVNKIYTNPSITYYTVN